MKNGLSCLVAQTTNEPNVFNSEIGMIERVLSHDLNKLLLKKLNSVVYQRILKDSVYKLKVKCMSCSGKIIQTLEEKKERDVLT